MANIVQIGQNAFIGSTGKITCDLNDTIKAQGWNGYMAVAYTNEIMQNMYCASGKRTYWKIRENIMLTRLTGLTGYRNIIKTYKLINWVKKQKPDLIQLHIVHGDWINLRILFDYLKSSNIPIVWTLHECWAFTGRCSHFELLGCTKWRTGCYECKNKKVYPLTYYFDFSKKMWADKKKWFTGLNNLTLVTPSEWLAGYVKQSFLSEYDVEVIHNGIDLDVYKHSEEFGNDQIYEKTKGRKVILGLTSSWTDQKGFSDIIALDSLINHDEQIIVMVGLNNKQLKRIPSSILGIKRTNNVQELVSIYSIADVYVNPTYQDNYPTTNLEACACGTPVVTYKTGGSVESVFDGKNGKIVEQGNVNAMYDAVQEILYSSSFNEKTCIDIAREYFGKEKCYAEYIGLYKHLLSNKT